MFLLARYEKAQDAMLALVENGALCVAFRADEHIAELRKLLHKYRNIPMSLADACIVRMSEIHDRHAVLTLDSDFSMYRKQPRSRSFTRRRGRFVGRVDGEGVTRRLPTR
jgi:predicted nucleic acid-binding protein